MDIKGMFEDLQMEICHAKLDALNNNNPDTNALADTVLAELSKVYKLVVELDNAVSGGEKYEWHIQEPENR